MSEKAGFCFSREDFIRAVSTGDFKFTTFINDKGEEEILVGTSERVEAAMKIREEGRKAG